LTVNCQRFQRLTVRDSDAVDRRRLRMLIGGVMAGRAITLGAAVVAGLLLCASFPPLDWWLDATVALALLGWVLTRPATTVASGLGYGFLFGLAFYLPRLP
jgi:apolipoprotein N-acyltransferase